MKNIKYQAMLFDLDGTLVNTAPDLSRAINNTLKEFGQPGIDESELLPAISQGTQHVLALAFRTSLDDINLNTYKSVFLNHYHTLLTGHGRLFDGIDTVLKTLADKNIRFGIVTNNSTARTTAIVNTLLSDFPPQCIVCADTLMISKPRPEPLLHAATLIDCVPDSCIYVGDAETDMQAAEASGMTGVFVTYGYGQDNSHPIRVNHALELLRFI